MDLEDRPLLLAWHRHLGACKHCRRERSMKSVVTTLDLCNVGRKRLAAALEENKREPELTPKDGQR